MSYFELVYFISVISGISAGVLPNLGLDIINHDMTVLCSSDSGDGNVGFCSTKDDCRSKGGRGVGPCVSGGVCCKVELSCGGSSDSPVAYFQSPNYPDKDNSDVACNFNIRTNPKVCQLRVDFLEFELPSPNLDGRCQANNAFNIYAPSTPNGILGGTEQVGICGLNNGQHLYIPVEPRDTVQMQFTLSGTSVVPLARVSSMASRISYIWNMKITQVECDVDNEAMNDLEAPSGCLQYFRGNFGTISSFNLDATSRMSPGQDYYICIFKSVDDTRTDCSVELRAQTFGLAVDSQEPACVPGNVVVNGAFQCCSFTGTSFLGINGEELGAGVNDPNIMRYRYCGRSLGGSNQITVSGGPYVINVRSGYWAIGAVQPSYAVGFNLDYKVNTGSC